MYDKLLKPRQSFRITLRIKGTIQNTVQTIQNTVNTNRYITKTPHNTKPVKTTTAQNKHHMK